MIRRLLARWRRRERYVPPARYCRNGPPRFRSMVHRHR